MFVKRINYCNVLPFVSEGCIVALVPLKDFLFPNLLLANFWFYMSCGFSSNDHNKVFAFVLFFEYLFSKGDGGPHVPNPGQFGQQLEKKKSNNKIFIELLSV